MIARVIWTKAAPELSDTWVEVTREILVPASRSQEGYRGYIGIIDRGSGVAMAVTLWEDENTERKSDEVARGPREQMAREAGAEVRVDRYEVAAFNIADTSKG